MTDPKSNTTVNTYDAYERLIQTTDALGSVRGLSNEKGKLNAEFEYDAFGNGKNNKKWNTYRFSSKEFEDHAGLYYFGARYYDPEVGRWLTPDPLGFIDGPDRYLYVANNPLNFIDPWGLLGERKLSALEWWLYESAVPGPFGEPVSEWEIGKSMFWGDPMRYTEEAGGTVMWLERGAIGLAAGATVVVIGAEAGIIPNYGFRIRLHPAEHFFPEYGERLRHLQINRWVEGVKDSGKAWRFPFK